VDPTSRGEGPAGAAHPVHLVVVPHTHWDREWYRPFEEFRYRLVRLVDGLLDLLESEPRFRHFMLDGQTIAAEDYLEVRPEARGRLVKHVESGRLLLGPWTVLPDEWLVSGEALVRNLRNGLRTAERLGGAMRVGYVPDQFGHVGQLPQIFAGFGLRTAVLWRGVGENVRETLFDWEAPDGTSVLTAYLRRGYGNADHLPRDPEALERRLRKEVASLGRRSRVPTLLLMNGTDHAAPDPGVPAALERALAALPDVTAEIGTLPGYLDRVGAEVPAERPRHRGELRSGLRAPLLPGCASARMPQKRADFENDRLLVHHLEPLAAWLQALGGDADPGMLDYLWRLALENHPHDSICGCSVDAVHEQMEARFARVREGAGALLERVCADLARRTRAPEGEGRPFAVWSPGRGGPTPVEAMVEVDEDPGTAGEPAWHLRRADGSPVEARVERREGARALLDLEVPPQAAWFLADRDLDELFGHALQDLRCSRQGDRLALLLALGRAPLPDAELSARRRAVREALQEPGLERVALRAVRRARLAVRFVDALPGTGLRTYRLCRGRAPAPRSPGAVCERLPDGSLRLRNGSLEIEAHPDGRVSAARRDGEAAVDELFRLVSEGDRGDEYNFDPVPGAPVVDRPTHVELEPLEQEGPCASLRWRARFALPAGLSDDRASRSDEYVETPVEVRLRLWRDLDRIDLRVDLDHRTRDERLRLWLRAPHAVERLRVESAFELAERPVEPPGPEAGGRPPAEWPVGATPQRRLAEVEGAGRSTVVANRGLPEVEALRDGEGAGWLAVTLLRAVGWLSRDDLVLRPGHAGPGLPTPGAQVPGPHRAEVSLRWVPAGDPERVHEALRFANPPLCFPLAPGAEGPLADGDRLVELDHPAAVISAVEPDREGSCLVRLWNASADRVQASLRWKAGGRLERVDLEGRPLSNAVSPPEAPLDLRGWEIASLRVRPAPVSTSRDAAPRR